MATRGRMAEESMREIQDRPTPPEPAAVQESTEEMELCEGCGDPSAELSEDGGMNLLCPACIQLGIEDDK